MKWLSREVTWKAFTYKKPSMWRLNIDRIWECILDNSRDNSKACFIIGKSCIAKVFAKMPQKYKAVRAKVRPFSQ